MDDLQKLILMLTARLGRQPTEDEMMDFIYGTHEERELLWNSAR